MIILRFFCYVEKNSKIINVQVANEYKNYIDEYREIGVNSKAQEFSIIKLFMHHLISGGVVMQGKLAKNFLYIKAKPVDSFCSVATDDPDGFELYMSEYEVDVLTLAKKFNLEIESAKLCCFCENTINSIHQKSIDDFEAAVNDVKFVKTIIDSISESEENILKEVKSFTELFKDNRTEIEAFYILYSNFGSDLPSVKEWVPGVYDFLKSKGWRSFTIKKVINEGSLGEVVFSEKISSEDQIYYKSIKKWKNDLLDNKSIDLCFKILYSKYGLCLPLARKWPEGLSDYCKKNGWNNSRVYSAFFPDRPIHKPLLLALLSHKDLAMNVDSAFYYTYIDSVLRSNIKGKFDVFIGKFRGNPFQKQLNKNDRLLLLYFEYVDIFKSCLMTFEQGREYLNNESIPIFVHILRCGEKPLELRPYDNSTSSNWVRSALYKYGENDKSLMLLAKAGISGQNFRSTHAVVDTFKKVNQGLIKEKLGHESVATTNLYTSRVETVSILKRKEISFQQYIIDQSRAVVEEVPVFNYSYAELEKRVVFGDVNIFAEWIAYRDKITKNKNRLIINNPSRWKKYWEVKIVEYDALLEMISSREYAEAEKISKTISLPHLD